MTVPILVWDVLWADVANKTTDRWAPGHVNRKVDERGWKPSNIHTDDDSNWQIRISDKIGTLASHYAHVSSQLTDLSYL